MAVNLSLCLIYKQNFIMGPCRKTHHIYRAWYCLWFQASTGGLGVHSPWIREDLSVHGAWQLSVVSEDHFWSLLMLYEEAREAGNMGT